MRLHQHDGLLLPHEVWAEGNRLRMLYHGPAHHSRLLPDYLGGHGPDEELVLELALLLADLGRTLLGREVRALRVTPFEPEDVFVEPNGRIRMLAPLVKAEAGGSSSAEWAAAVGRFMFWALSGRRADENQPHHARIRRLNGDVSRRTETLLGRVLQGEVGLDELRGELRRELIRQDPLRPLRDGMLRSREAPPPPPTPAPEPDLSPPLPPRVQRLMERLGRQSHARVTLLSFVQALEPIVICVVGLLVLLLMLVGFMPLYEMLRGIA
jgi:hypothetical protein